MALSIRLQRGGSKADPHYRMVVAERTCRRDGRFVEILGNYSPRAEGTERFLNLKLDRIDFWTQKGAQPTDTAATLIKRARKTTAKAA